MYNLEALERGIEKCKENIKVFEDAIEKERDTIKEYYGMMDTLRNKENTIKELKEKIHIEIDNDG
jgi:hypothetical protein